MNQPLSLYTGTSMEVDEDVRLVAAFMQTHITASRLVSVANWLAQLAPLLWGQHEAERVQAVRLVSAPIIARTPPASTGFLPVVDGAGDDSAGVADRAS